MSTEIIVIIAVAVVVLVAVAVWRRGGPHSEEPPEQRWYRRVTQRTLPETQRHVH